MANTYVDYTATAGQTDFAFSFPYLEDSHVVVEVEGVDQTLTTNYTIETSPAQKIVLSSPTTAIAGGELVRIKRVSDPSTNLVDFVNGSVLTETELDRAYLHNRYLAEEAYDGVNAGLGEVEGSTNYNANNKQIKNLADGTLATDAVNKGYVDTQIALTDTNLAGFFKSTHTGNAVDNVFTLSFTPQTTEAEAYIVSIDGLVQVPDTDYTIGATDITFNTIPANSAEICVVATAAASVATVNEAQVTATGSTTARSLADRFADVVNVLDFIPASQHTYILGNDLSSQDGSLVTTGIQNAFNAGFDVFIPRGIYKISSTLTIPTQNSSRKKPMFIYGTMGNTNIETQNASTLAFEGSGACIDGVNALDNQSRICIKDLAIYIPGYTKTAGTIGIDLQQPVNTSVENVCIAGFDIGIQGVDGFWYSTYRRLRIFNCNIGFRIEGASGTNSDGSAKGGANGMTISESFISTCGYGFYTRYTTEQLNILNCTIEASTTNSIYSEFFRQINITNCYFEEACSGNIIRGVREVNRDSQLNLTGNNFQADIGGTSIVYISNVSNEDFKVNARDQYLFLKTTATAGYFLASNSTATKLYMPTPIQQYEGTGSKLLTGLVSGATEEFSVGQDNKINIGTGLKFGNSDFEYEEGTWTPVLNIAGGANAHTYAIQDGSYIKAGQQVTVTFRLTINSVDPGTGDVSIGGLPFITLQSAAGVAFSLIAGITLTSPYTSVLGQADGSTDIKLHKLSNGSYAVVQNADLSTACYLMGTMTYITN